MLYSSADKLVEFERAIDPVATTRGSDTQFEERFCRTVTNRRPISNWRVAHALKTNLPSLRSFDDTARESFMSLIVFFAIAARLKKLHRRRS